MQIADTKTLAALYHRRGGVYPHPTSCGVFTLILVRHYGVSTLILIHRCKVFTLILVLHCGEFTMILVRRCEDGDNPPTYCHKRIIPLPLPAPTGLNHQ
jgi:hypothetical protein